MLVSTPTSNEEFVQILSSLATDGGGQIVVESSVGINENITVPSNIYVKIGANGYFYVESTGSILFLGTVEVSDVDNAFQGVGIVAFSDVIGEIQSNTQVIKPQTFGAVADGITDDTSSISQMASLVHLYPASLPPGTYHISSDLTLNGTWKFDRGAMLFLESGVTVTIAGQIEAGLYQLFQYEDETCQVNFSFPSAVAEVSPEWWGAIGDNNIASAAANSLAFNRMLRVNTGDNTYRNPIIVRGSSHTYYVDDTIWVQTNIRWFNAGYIINSNNEDKPAIRIGRGISVKGYTRATDPTHLFSTEGIFSDWMVGRTITIYDNKGIGQSGDYTITSVISATEVVLEEDGGGTPSFVYEDSVEWALDYLKLWRIQIENITLVKSASLQRISGDGFSLDAVDFLTLKKAVVQGFKKGIRSGHTAHTQTYQNIELSGNLVGYYSDSVRDEQAGPPNVSSFDGGKSQQNQHCGFYIRNSAGHKFSSMDLSLNGGGQGWAYIKTLASTEYADGQTFSVTRELPTVGTVTATFEFDNDASTTPGNVPISLITPTDADGMRDRIAIAINTVAALDLTVDTDTAATVILKDACTLATGTYDAPIDLSTSTIPTATLSVPAASELSAGERFKLNDGWIFQIYDTGATRYEGIFDYIWDVDISSAVSADDVRDEVVLAVNRSTVRTGISATAAGTGLVNLFYCVKDHDGHFGQELSFNRWSVSTDLLVFQSKTALLSAWYGSSVHAWGIGGLRLSIYTESVGGLWLQGTGVSSLSGRHNNRCRNVLVTNCGGGTIHNTTMLCGNANTLPVSDSTEWALYLERCKNMALQECTTVTSRKGIYFDNECTNIVERNTEDQSNSATADAVRYVDDTAGELTSLSSCVHEVGRTLPRSPRVQNFAKSPWNFDSLATATDDTDPWFPYSGSSDVPTITGTHTGPDGTTAAQVLYWNGTLDQPKIRQHTDTITNLQDGTKTAVIEFWTCVTDIDAPIAGSQDMARLNVYLNTGTRSLADWLSPLGSPSAYTINCGRGGWVKHKLTATIPEDVSNPDSYLILVLSKYNGGATFNCALGGFSIRFQEETTEYIDKRIGDSGVNTELAGLPLVAPVGIVYGDSVGRLLSAEAAPENADELLSEGMTGFFPGDLILNTSAAPVNVGWYCTESGNPGTWGAVPVCIEHQFDYDFGTPGTVPGHLVADITVSGVKIGDIALVSCTDGVGEDFVLSASVESADTVKVKWTQLTGVAADPDGAGSTYYLRIIKTH